MGTTKSHYEVMTAELSAEQLLQSPTKGLLRFMTSKDQQGRTWWLTDVQKDWFIWSHSNQSFVFVLPDKPATELISWKRWMIYWQRRRFNWLFQDPLSIRRTNYGLRVAVPKQKAYAWLEYVSSNFWRFILTSAGYPFKDPYDL